MHRFNFRSQTAAEVRWVSSGNDFLRSLFRSSVFFFYSSTTRDWSAVHIHQTALLLSTLLELLGFYFGSDESHFQTAECAQKLKNPSTCSTRVENVHVYGSGPYVWWHVSLKTSSTSFTYMFEIRYSCVSRYPPWQEVVVSRVYIVESFPNVTCFMRVYITGGLLVSLNHLLTNLMSDSSLD